MSEYTKEQAYELFDQIIDLLEGKPMMLVLEVLSNIVRNTCDNVTPQQKAAIVMTMLDAMGIEEEGGETLQ